MRKYVINFLFVSLFIIIPILSFSFYAEPLYGDLTRIGRWTERDFGPNAQHPTIHVKRSGRSLHDFDVVVLGDSFSNKNLWQSVFSENTGHIVKTFEYGQRNCISNWIDAAIADPSIKIVIVETVERSFVDRFNRIPPCLKGRLFPLQVEASVEEGRRPTWPLTPDFFYTATTAINVVRSRISNEKYSNRYLTVNTSLRNECALFSNRQKDRFLYYSEDDLKQEWNEAEIVSAIKNILKIQNKVEKSGKKFIFMIAPDKSSVYRDCLWSEDVNIKMPNINEILINFDVHAPNMQLIFKSKISKVMDLYDPDNTHWSSAGYILAAEAIGNYLKRDLSSEHRAP